MSFFKSFVFIILWILLSILSAIGLATIGSYLYLAPSLPNPQELREIELQTPLRIYSADNKLISEMGEKRRTPLHYEDVPPIFIDALLASEDDAFFEHVGIDFKGLIRAAVILAKTGQKRSGGSTITMQVAKNYFLSSEKTFTRKLTEIMLALKIEHDLSKEEILELYINKIYLGKRAYGIEAAAQVYFGKSIKELNLAEIAMIAGLPQAPSAANPINNPQRAFDRRNYVLQRMLTLGKISQDEYQDAATQPITASYHGATSELNAPYVAEMVRKEMVARYGDEAYTKGFNVYTTILSENQEAANHATQRGLIQYDRDHGWRMPQKVLPLQLADAKQVDWPATFLQWQGELAKRAKLGLLIPAVVSRVEDEQAWFYTGNEEISLPLSSFDWAKRFISQDLVGPAPTSARQVLKPGLEVWLEQRAQGYLLAQVPEAEVSLVSLRPQDGALLALVGGFSPASNQFNRAIQADRQPGSAFKPFIYSAALANGFTPASIINDAPVVFNDAALESTWRPQNDSGKFYGPTRLREALYRSQNLVSIRILNQVGPATAIRYISPFGFPRQKLNADLSLALGASAVTPLELATGYAVFANGGFSIEPYFIERIEDEYGTVLFQAAPRLGCEECENASRVIDKRTHFLMISMMRDVVRLGTGRRALVLNRDDIAGKTGTTNDQKDAWFAGFTPDVVSTVWVGFDQPRSLGRWAFGANTALPIWVDYMSVALAKGQSHPFEQPAGVVSVRIDPATGLLAAPGQTDSIFEYFKEEEVPRETARSSTNNSSQSQTYSPEQLF